MSSVGREFVLITLVGGSQVADPLGELCWLTDPAPAESGLKHTVSGGSCAASVGNGSQ